DFSAFSSLTIYFLRYTIRMPVPIMWLGVFNASNKRKAQFYRPTKRYFFAARLIFWRFLRFISVFFRNGNFRAR
ncbi:MAG: hypothetical protein LBJ86_05145, partial [Spirochaetaceae bacterium]|nr:hypothetical protein [Spirochaetaceae bacterium]